jgi:hypothetical protein
MSQEGQKLQRVCNTNEKAPLRGVSMASLKRDSRFLIPLTVQPEPRLERAGGGAASEIAK